MEQSSPQESRLRSTDRLVSVVIPVYNGRRYIAEALQSVCTQDYDQMETIVVDDASTDGTADFVRQAFPRALFFSKEHGGAASARNCGVKMAHGSYLAFLDADDIWEPHKIAHQIQELERDPSLDIVFGHVRQFTSPELDPDLKNKLFCPPESLPGLLPGTMLLRAETFRRVGPFETTWEIGEFIAWFAKAIDLGLRHRVLEQVVLQRRLHSTNQGVLKRAAKQDYLRILKVTLDRRRTKTSTCSPHTTQT